MRNDKEYFKQYYLKNKDKKREQGRIWNESHREQTREISRKHYWKHRERILGEFKIRYRLPKYRFYALKASAKCRGLLVEINLDDFIKITKELCNYCGESNKGFGVDRSDSSIGYLKENCVSCCSTCNFMKLSMSKEQFLEQIEKIYKYNQ